IPKHKIQEYFLPICKEFDMNYSLYFTNQIPSVAIFVSRYTHCLYDLLLRYRESQFKCNISFIISNHLQAKKIADSFSIKFFYFPIKSQNKQEQEKKLIFLLKKEKIDLIVLARYTQILTKQFVDKFPNKIINIHHSFLPAFVGREPYKQAYSRGVKIIGATSHYVTEELDAGPIIEQDTVRITHKDTLEDLKQKGQDLEKLVLSRAVRWHLEHKILVYNNKTVIFD
ncbi:MAG: formyltetrahydrofolate deformylase, partial [Candidatus Omnitrophica bacterium]|nr:formyltetrahydrofolate deformylase [Candidatus Omnitrophota bacterium]